MQKAIGTVLVNKKTIHLDRICSYAVCTWRESLIVAGTVGVAIIDTR
jgi:hypothetical protein